MKKLLITLLTFAMLVSLCSFCVLGDDTGAGEGAVAEQPETKAFPFYDVSVDRWSNPYVALLFSEGIVDGMTPVTFHPADSVTRAQFVKMLCGAVGGVTEGAEHAFEDVESGSWYEPFVAWAAEQGIVDGVAPGRFAPSALISRQDMATMIYRYLDAETEEPEDRPEGLILPIEPIEPITPPEQPPIVLPVEPKPEPEIMSISEEGEVPEESGIPKVNEAIEFTDGDDVAEYAMEAVSLMQQAGILGGVPNGDGSYRFEPKNNATREQAAKMLAQLFLILNEDKTLPDPVEYATYKYVLYDHGTDWYLQDQDFRAQGTLDPAEDLVLPTPEKFGYTFDGWMGAGLDGLVKDAVIKRGTVYDNVRYYAYFTPVEYKIEYKLNGGVLPEGTITSYNLETPDQYIPTPQREGYIFEGWKVNGAEPVKTVKLVKNDTNGDLTLEAVWREDNDSNAACAALAQWITTAELDNEYMDKKDTLFHPEGCPADIMLAMDSGVEGADVSYLTFCHDEESGISAIFLVYERAGRKYVIEVHVQESSEKSVTIFSHVWIGAKLTEQPAVSVKYSSEGFKGLTVTEVIPNGVEEDEADVLMNDVTDFLEMKGLAAICSAIDGAFTQLELDYTWESFR